MHGTVVREVVLVIQTRRPKQGVAQVVAAAQQEVPDQCLDQSMPQVVAVAAVVATLPVQDTRAALVLPQGVAAVVAVVA